MSFSKMAVENGELVTKESKESKVIDQKTLISPELRDDCTGIGDCTGLRGDCTEISDCTGLRGDCTEIGDCTGLRGDCTGIDDCTGDDIADYWNR